VNLNRCDAGTIDSYASAIRATDDNELPLLLLFREPYHYAELHSQYHPPENGYLETLMEPPNFGFNGNHIYFSGHNYYILDGHHKALAYARTKRKPFAIEIECVALADRSYPVPYIEPILPAKLIE
jgi:hypothetical protein